MSAQPAQRKDSTVSGLQSAHAQMLFLIGHGLQTPLSAIRWGCQRLGKTDREKLTDEQVRIIESISTQAKVLSSMLTALLLVSRIEEGTYEPRNQDIYLKDFLLNCVPLLEAAPGFAASLECPDDLVLHADRVIVESLFQAVAVILATAVPPGVSCVIHVTKHGEECMMELSSPLEFSVLRQSPMSGESPSLVGGEPGLMLSVSTSLCNALGGNIQVRPKSEGRHELVLRLALQGPSLQRA